MNIFDAVIIGITLILGIKGFFNGFIKEIAGLIGIIGGLFLASKFFHPVGIYINEHIFKINNQSAIDLVGFIVVFVGFWIVAIFIGFLFGKILKLSALGVFDRILGFIFSSMKFFILVAIILTLLYKVQFIRENIQKYVKNSVVFPLMINIGDKIINISPKELEKKVTNSFKNVKIPIN
ncbi:CvpA family protein [Caminibacter mediatlanticus]|uniref:Colicin V production protein n=1 Tax=Caminibacter mediatlanticus TB-2 TaxID=391592 RepID=A0AAI9AIB7_9BACT|nr:CvpA family protein [Caminibacter mediatlanticus]EDM24162.1 Colicin V production protein [Caminibacter mediatlanticus TB-2]